MLSGAFKGGKVSGIGWLATGTAVALVLSATAAVAQPVSGGAEAASQSSRAFDIPSQPLTSAITAFGSQSGVQVTVEGSVLRGRTSQGVSGRLAPAEALSRLLSGTGVTFRWLDAGSVALEAAPEASGNSIQLGAIRVEGATAGGNIAWSPGEGDFDGDPQDAPYRTAGSVNYIAREQIERFRGSTAGDIFKSTPGVISAMNNNGASVDVNIRGLQGMNRVVTSVDGSEASLSTWRGYQGVDNRTYIDPDLIGRVDITKGPDGGASGAIGGTVAISTIGVDDILRDGQTYGVRLRGGLTSNGVDPLYTNSTTRTRAHSEQPEVYDAGNFSASLAMGLRQDRLDLVFGYVQRRSGNKFAGKHGDLTVQSAPTGTGTPIVDTLSPFKYGEEVLNTSEEVASGLLKATVRLSETQTLRLAYLRYENTFGEVMPTRIGDAGRNQYPPASIELDQFTWRYDYRPTDNDLVDLRLSGWISNADEDNVAYGISYATSVGRILARSRSVGIEAVNTSRFYADFGDVSLRYGGSYKREDVRPRNFLSAATSDSYASDGTRDVSSVFANGKWEPKDWLSVDGSLTWLWYKTRNRQKEHYSNYLRQGYPPYESYEGNGFSPGLGVTFTPGEHWQIYGRFSTGIRPPSMRESTYTASALLFNPDLKHERAENYEIGVNYLKDGLFLDHDKVRLKLAYFDNRVKNYIGRLYETALPYSTTRTEMQLKNFDLYQIKGVEFSAGYAADRGFADLGVSYYTDFRLCRTMGNCVDYTLSSDYSTNHMPPELYITLSGGLHFFDKRLTVGGRVLHASKRLAPLVRDGSFFFVTTVWAPYTVGDVYANWKVTDTVALDFSVENVGDRYYIDALNNSALPAPGRNYRLSLTTQFGGDKPLWGGRLFGLDGTRPFDGDWSGPYVGLHFGQVIGRSEGVTSTYSGLDEDRASRESADQSFDNVSGGFVAGFNHQYANGVVLGFEADINWGRFSGRSHIISDESTRMQESGYFETETLYDWRWFSTLRARLGHTIDEDTFVYVTGGLAALRERQKRDQYRAQSTYLTQTVFFFGEKDEGTRTGWTLGGGAEKAIGDKWSVKLEYLYAGFGDKRFFFPEGRRGVTLNYQTNVQIGTETRPPALAPDHALCTRPVPHARCYPTEVAIYETITGTSNIAEGRVAKNDAHIHNLRIGLNYRF